MLIIQFPYVENVWLAFLMATKNFQVYLKLPQTFFCVIFQLQIDFRTQTNIFEEKNLHAKFIFLCV